MTSYTDDDELTIDSTIQEIDNQIKKKKSHKRNETIIVNNIQNQPPIINQLPCIPDPVYTPQEIEKLQEFRKVEEYLTKGNIPLNPLYAISYGTTTLPKSDIQIENEALKNEALLRTLSQPLDLNIDVALNNCVGRDANTPFLISPAKIAVSDILNAETKYECNPYTNSSDLIPPFDIPLVEHTALPCDGKICEAAFGTPIPRQQPQVSFVQQDQNQMLGQMQISAQMQMTAQTSAQISDQSQIQISGQNPCEPKSEETFDISNNKTVVIKSTTTTVNVVMSKPGNYMNAVIELPPGECLGLPNGRVVNIINKSSKGIVAVKAPGGFKGVVGVILVKGKKNLNFIYTVANGWTQR